MTSNWLNWLILSAQELGLNYQFLRDDFDRHALILGVQVSLALVCISVCLSLLCSVGFLLGLQSHSRLIALSVRGFVEFLRNTPTLVQLYVAYLVFNTCLTQWIAALGWSNPLSAFWWAVLVLSIHKAAFHADALRASFHALPSTLRESALTLGFSRWQVFFYFEMPLVVRAALPSLINNLIDLAKASSVASAIAVADFNYASIIIWYERDNVFELMLLLLAFYSLLTFFLNYIGRFLENRLSIPGYGR